MAPVEEAAEDESAMVQVWEVRGGVVWCGRGLDMLWERDELSLSG